jgi:hypothetical protein
VRWLLVVVAACGAPARAPVHAQRAPAPDAARAPIEPAPTAAECDALVAHAVQLAAADQRAHERDHASDDDAARVERDLSVEYGPSCRAMSRAGYRCALAAATLDAFAACGGPAQATRSSSTSNSSVAPGGITPAAPRSP